MDIVLASGSPRRRELLERAQLNFTILRVDIDETPLDNESPTDYIERMVETKADAAIQQLSDTSQADHDSLTSPFIILTSDTIGVLSDGKTVWVKLSIASTHIVRGTVCLKNLHQRRDWRFKPPPGPAIWPKSKNPSPFQNPYTFSLGKFF